ncbi:MAG: phenylalanine--tRNA ligase subunit beta [Bacilli bacterium]|nr:phenylalanine--tRNA ligase subunit beta [Bacilli bacterium]
MILSRNFVKDYIDLDDKLDIITIAEEMTRVGNEYDFAGKFVEATNLVIGEIVKCEDHPDSDHLHVCNVNVGKEILQIVCGAPNAREGLKVIVALAGAKLPGGEIKKGSIRGVESNGMMCSIAELGLDNKFLSDKDRDGIAELSKDAPVGEDALKYLGFDDEIVDFELTANRGDLLSIIGMAYELGAIYDKKVKDIEIEYDEIKDNIKDEFNIDIKTDNCSLFLAKKVKNVVIKDSPDFIKNRLMASGIRPINNVVDISNYVMLETGQPLHFYDADKLGKDLVVRMATKDEKLTTLDNIERVLDENMIVIANKNEAVGLAGVMGGLTTEVESDTKNVIIESAIFDNVLVRKASKVVVRSEASNRFEKGLDPKRTYMAIERACTLLQKYASGEVLSGTLEYDKTNKKEKIIEITVENINNVLGTDLDSKTIINVFDRLGFISKEKDNKITVSVPTRRLDINIKEDLIEEVGRIYGINNIEGKLPKLNVKEGSYDKTNRLIRNKLVDLGLNEVLTPIFMSDNISDMYKEKDTESIYLLDPLFNDRNTIRTSLIPSLLSVYEYNNARNLKDVSIFEIAKSFYKKEEKYFENKKLCILMTGDYYYQLGNNNKVDFYIIKGIVEELLIYLGYANRYSLLTDNIPSYMHPGQSAIINLNGKDVGIIGKMHPNVAKDVFICEINLDRLLENRVSKLKYKEINKYPSIQKDMAFVMDKDITAEAVIKLIKKSGGKLVTDINVFDVYEGENVAKNKKSIAFNLTFEDSSRTLTDEEVMKVFNNIIKEVETKLNIKLRNM